MYNNYEEYMREVLGYPYNNQNCMQSNSMNGYYNNYQKLDDTNYNKNSLHNLYPEIYKIIKPMVKTTCQMYTNQSITEEIIDEITLKIYNNVEEVEDRTSETEKTLKNGDVVNPNAKKENRSYRNNYLLKDLIKILVLDNFIKPEFGAPHNVPPRPGYITPPGVPQINNGGIPGNMRPPMRKF